MMQNHEIVFLTIFWALALLGSSYYSVEDVLSERPPTLLITLCTH